MAYDRLTRKVTYNGDIVYAKPIHSPESRAACESEVLRRLYEYEEMFEAGLLLKLPCKIGTTVYVVFSKYGRYKVGRGEVWHFRKDNSHNKDTVLIGIHNYDSSARTNCTNYSVDSLGEKWFFTREEAEAKLAEILKEVNGEV